MGNHEVDGARRRAASQHASESAAFHLRRARSLSLRDWPVSWRLVAVIVMALVMGVVFGGLRVAEAASTAAGFARTTQLAVLGEKVTALAQALENERDLQVGIRSVIDVESSTGYQRTDVAPGVVELQPYSAAQLEEAATANATLQSELRSAENATNAAAAQVRELAAQIGGAFPASTSAKAQAVVTDIDDITGLRASMGYEPPSSALDAYEGTIADLFALNDEITSGSDDPALADEVRTLGSISQAKDQASQQRAILYSALLEDTWVNIGGTEALTSAQALENADLSEFQSSASPNEVNNFAFSVTAAEVNSAQLINDDVGLIGVPQSSNPASRAPQRWYSSMSRTVNKMRGIEEQQASAIVARSQLLQQGAKGSALLNAILTAVILLLVLIATVVVARSLVRPLRRLQAGALDIATVQLPDRVRQLSEAEDPGASLEVAPIDVPSADEIGQVARAFDQVHSEAVRLAGNEAILRRSLNAMFINLSRRSQSLIERLARMIDSLEQNEDDPDRLSNLFSMDHLVTRMRRNSENLLLLAGHEGARRWSEPVPLTDVARAATSEIEQYLRVTLNIQPGIAVSGQAVSDIVHLLAELIENATIFSSKDTPVRVSGQELTSGGVLIEVSDNGVGIPEARLEEMNWRLDNPPVIDVSVSRHMGLFAVARLAERHGVRVRLRARAPRGLTAMVWLPDSVIEQGPRPYGAHSRPFAAQSAQPFALQAVQPLATQPFMPQPAQPSAPPAARPFAPPVTQPFTPQSAEPSAAAATRETAQAADPAASNWFRGRQPSAARTAGDDSAAAPGDGRLSGTAGLAEGKHAARIVANPVHGALTPAGLPVRVPRANLIPGSVGGHRAGGGTTRQASEAQALAAPRAQRSPETARSHLGGFQRGARRAKSQAPRPGEEASH